MSDNVCPQCGAPIMPGATECKYCGEKFAQAQANQTINNPQNVQAQPQFQTQTPPQPQTVYIEQPRSAIEPSWPIKSKIVAGILGIFLGGLGIHKFYLGKTGMGIVYLLLCWTSVPAFVGFIEGIIYLCSNDENFQLKNHVRIHQSWM